MVGVRRGVGKASIENDELSSVLLTLDNALRVWIKVCLLYTSDAADE